MITEKKELQKIENKLRGWFSQNKESWFFRENRTAYKVWVSEVALQQTRIQAALHPLRRFLENFPDLESLANASEDKVLNAFRGLGYYNRARNLRKGAIYIKENLGGVFPQTAEDLKKIPSIGDYTAAAISSICFGENIAVLDGNVKRILSRLFLIEDIINTKPFLEKCALFQEQIFSISETHAGDLNEAFMELGQKICLPKNPRCINCPVENFCKARKKKKVLMLPRKEIKKSFKEVLWHIFVITDKENRVLLQKYKSFYFLKNHWAFPSFLVFLPEQKKISSYDEKQHVFATIENSSKSAAIHHSITNHKIKIHPHLIKEETLIKSDASFIWVKTNEIQDYLAASAMLKVWEHMSSGMLK